MIFNKKYWKNKNFKYYCFNLESDIQSTIVSGYKIKKATLPDYIKSYFFQGALKTSLKNLLKRRDEHFLAISKGEITAAGVICYADTPEVLLDCQEVSLISFKTLPEHRRKGLYVALIQEMLIYLKKKGFTKVYIWADSNNSASLRGIEKAGFKFLE